MSIKLVQHVEIGNEKVLSEHQHLLFVVSSYAQFDIPFLQSLNLKLKRIEKEIVSLNKSPVIVELPQGNIASFVMLEDKLDTFQRHALLLKALKPLLDENPQQLAICVIGDSAFQAANAPAAYYVTTVNALSLPSHKKDWKDHPLNEVVIYGHADQHPYEAINARVAGNILCRQLTVTPPNELTPTIYREKIKALAHQHSWQHQEYDMATLKSMGAGAFVAVGQGSDPQDAAIVHLTYAPPSSKKHIALIGKGICFDTGGHNIKPAKYMSGMHEDMNGSAVALGILLAATQLQLDIKIDCWLAIAQNHIGPLAYKQNDVVRALNGTTIEIVHTDAEGRMVLADTLTLASRQKPDFMIDFATLTGSMMTALGDRMSGVLGNRPELLCKAIGAGNTAGERIVAFPYDEDYESDLDSDVADIKQCTLEGGADHIHAARFLGRFIEHDVAWLHVDLSAATRKGGLGAVQTDTTGFGVGFGLALLTSLDA